MTGRAPEVTAERASPGPRGEYVVTVRDDVDARIAGHEAGAYVSPPQPLGEALALVGILLGGSAAADGRERWTQAMPGGRRTITLTCPTRR